MTLSLFNAIKLILDNLGWIFIIVIIITASVIIYNKLNKIKAKKKEAINTNNGS